MPCAVALCQNTFENVKNKGNKICFHRFPLKDIKRAQLWFALCQRRDREHTIPKASDVICSEHFSEDAYIRDLRNELLGLPQRKKLKFNAIPSLNLPKRKLMKIKLSKGKVISKATSHERKRTNCRKRMRQRKVCSASTLHSDANVGVKKATKPSTGLIISDLQENSGNSTKVPTGKLKNRRTVITETKDMNRVKNDTHCQDLLRSMFDDEALMDVTLIAEDKSIRAHRVVLRNASGYFKQVLSLDMTAECEMRFKDIGYDDLEKIIAFIYQGEVSVRMCELNKFLKAAQILEVWSLLPWTAVKKEPSDGEEVNTLVPPPVPELATQETGEEIFKMECATDVGRKSKQEETPQTRTPPTGNGGKAGGIVGPTEENPAIASLSPHPPRPSENVESVEPNVRSPPLLSIMEQHISSDDFQSL